MNAFTDAISSRRANSAGTRIWLLRLMFRSRPLALLAVAFFFYGSSSVGGFFGAPALASECLHPRDHDSIKLTQALTQNLGSDPEAPEPASGYRAKTLVLARSYMVVTANPYASKVGCDILSKGGSAADAAVAVQAMLGLVEPQSSGLGGGAFMLYYDAAKGQVRSYDGREKAPAAATEDYLRYISATDTTPPAPVSARMSLSAMAASSSSGSLPVDFLDRLRQSGRSIGTPGVVRMLELAHLENGLLPWHTLFQSAIDLAIKGFPISARLADAISAKRILLKTDPEAAAYFLDADGSPKTRGTLLRNPAYASTLAKLAKDGADVFYHGPIAEAIVRKIHLTGGGNPYFAITPGLTELSDLTNYQAQKRDPVCTTYRRYWICGMGPPSSGGLTVASTLGVLENFDMARYRPTDLDIHGGRPTVIGVHLVSEAERLAYADRNKYIADTDFISLPGGSPAALLDKHYLRERAKTIDLSKSMGTASAGNFSLGPRGSSATEGNGTTHMTIVDQRGNVAVMTSTIESSLGSFRFTHGFLLNNQLTDFSILPADANGPIANRIQANKRPRSSMAPTLVFKMNADGSRGEFLMGTGSPGGATIIQYVSKTLVGFLDWGLDAQQATSMIDFGASNSVVTNVGGEHPNVNSTQSKGGNAGDSDPLVTGLRALHHVVSMAAQSSGIATIAKTRRHGTTVLEGGADPRRESLTLGNGLVP